MTKYWSKRKKPPKFKDSDGFQINNIYLSVIKNLTVMRLNGLISNKIYITLIFIMIFYCGIAFDSVI